MVVAKDRLGQRIGKPAMTLVMTMMTMMDAITHAHTYGPKSRAGRGATRTKAPMIAKTGR